MTRREAIGLNLVGYGGAALGIASGVVIFDVAATVAGFFDLVPISRSHWVLDRPGWALILFGLSVPTLWFALHVSGPAIMTLRRGTVSVFRGKGRTLAGFDQNQRNLERKNSVPVEIVVMADGRTPLRANETSLPLCRLRPPARVARDRGPDTRPLTEAELRELDDLVRHYRTPCIAAFREVLWIPIVGMLLTARLWARLDANVLIFFSMLIGVALVVAASRISSYRAFAKTLRQDRKDAVLTGGRLWSGLPWVVNGEPARWRLARPAVGTNSLHVAKLEALDH